MSDLVKLSIKSDGPKPQDVKVMINDKEVKGLFGLELKICVGEVNTAVLYAYVDHLDIDAQVLAKLVDVKEVEEVCS